MKKTSLLTTVAAAAVIAGTGLVSAQSRDTPRAGAAPAAKQAAPAEKSSGAIGQGSTSQGSASQGAASDVKGTQGAASEATGDRPAAGGERTNRSRSAQDKIQDRAPARAGASPNGQSSEGRMSNDGKASSAAEKANDTKASPGSRSSTDKSMDRNKSSDDANAKQRSTSGQGAAAGASANLTTEQRTRITSVIKEQKVRPMTNVNFSIAIGTRVPRSVHFYALPTTVVEVYPEWRGYRYILVGDEIVIVNPRTYEIVYIIES
ncbi:MAG: DUF1236 domain-containing protein [Pseudorhodoplanes sp.]